MRGIVVKIDGTGRHGLLRRVAGASVVAIASLAVLGAGTAQAEDLSMTATKAYANVGLQLDDEALFEAPKTAPFEAQINRTTGAITDGHLEVPDFTKFIDNPIDANVTFEFEIGDITGTFDEATGELAASGKAGGTLTADGKQCAVAAKVGESSLLELSTEGNSGGDTNPRSGERFVNGLTGPGAVAGTWTDMTATESEEENQAFCNNVYGEIGGPGGIWLYAEGDVTPPEAPLLISTNPASPSTSGTPRIVGTAETDSTVELYGSSNCTGTPIATSSASELAAPGISVEVEEGTTAVFSAAATDPASNVSPCSDSISYTRKKPPVDPPAEPPVEPPAQCVVPDLVGKKLPRAKKALRKANCELGRVHKPRQHKGRRGKGKKRRPLVVKQTRPGAGATPANGKVNLKLKLNRKSRR